MSIRSSTQLHSFRLADLRVEFNDEWLWTPDDDHCPEEYEVRPDFEVFGSLAEGDALIRLSVTCAPAAESAGACRFRVVAATVWGILRFADEVGSGERERRVFLNGPVMLHGLLRGVLAAATGSCAGGPFVLPTVNYVEVLRRQAEQPQLPVADAATADDVPPAVDAGPQASA